jgi:threonyl-tRNA synthetase
LLENYDIRGLFDDLNEKIGNKIRDTELKKIPYMVVIGEKEEAENKVAVRKQGEGDLGSFSIEEFAKMINNEIDARLSALQVGQQ